MAINKPYMGPVPDLGSEKATPPTNETATGPYPVPIASSLQMLDLAGIEGDAELQEMLDEQFNELLSRLEPRGFDVVEAVNHLNANALPRSIGRCATYVRLALQAGGLDVRNNPVAARDYGPFLRARGFVEVSGDDFMAGDVAVMRAFRGRSKNHPYGHVQMYNGEQWVADFKQSGFWPGRDYREATPDYVVYRWSGH